jgi:hypothetical protein
LGDFRSSLCRSSFCTGTRTVDWEAEPNPEVD